MFFLFFSLSETFTTFLCVPLVCSLSKTCVERAAKWSLSLSLSLCLVLFGPWVITQQCKAETSLCLSWKTSSGYQICLSCSLCPVLDNSRSWVCKTLVGKCPPPFLHEVSIFCRFLVFTFSLCDYASKISALSSFSSVWLRPLLFLVLSLHMGL